MIAALHRKNTPRVGKLPLFDVLHPGSIDADRKVVLLLASDCARVASDAFPIVDDKTVIHCSKGKYTVKPSI